MVTRLLKHSLLFSIMLSLNACSDDDGIDIIDIKVPEGYALSADISTIFSIPPRPTTSRPTGWRENISPASTQETNYTTTPFQAERTLRLAALVRSMRVSPVAAAHDHWKNEALHLGKL